MPRPIAAHIDTNALAYNYDRVKALANNAPLMAVVKADAYGHGLDAAFKGFAAADSLALIEIENALRLRAMGWQKPILLLEGAYSEIDWRAAAEHHLDCAIHSDEQLSQLESIDLPRKLHVYLKLNTGMNRLGFRADRAKDIAARLQKLATIEKVTLMTHFASADLPDGYLEQLSVFNAACEGLPFDRSISNSASCVNFAAIQNSVPTAQYINRAGIILYGATPFTHAAKNAAALKVKPAMTLSSEIIGVQTLKAGESVGYGATYTVNKPERIAVVACGYADGYPRHAPTGTPVLIDGLRAPLVGRVSMDKIAVDISAVPLARVGSHVELWGKQLAVDEVANSAGTIGYELLTAVSARVPRICP